MGLSLAQQAIFTKQIDFPKIKYKNVEYFSLEHAHKPKYGLPVPNFFIALFLSFFSALLLSLPFPFHILSGCPKSWVLIMGKAGNGTLINYRYNGTFYDHFCTKTDNVVFQFATSECRRYPKQPVCG